MVHPAPPPRRGAVERAAAWLWTGPPGHLYSTVADIAVFAVRSLARRAGLRRR